MPAMSHSDKIRMLEKAKGYLERAHTLIDDVGVEPMPHQPPERWRKHHQPGRDLAIATTEIENALMRVGHATGLIIEGMEYEAANPETRPAGDAS